MLDAILFLTSMRREQHSVMSSSCRSFDRSLKNPHACFLSYFGEAVCAKSRIPTQAWLYPRRNCVNLGLPSVVIS
jgi:hypothetical protein